MKQKTQPVYDAVDGEKWVHDYSVDYKGRVPLRASTGGWKASFFVIAIEFSERMSYYGLATSLILYLTRVMHQDVKSAAMSVNHWSGITTLMPLIGAFVADAYLGRFRTILVSSTVYLLGLTILTMASFLPILKPCENSDNCKEPRKIHEVVFFLAIYLISIGTGGHKPSLESFGADQFDDDNDKERKQKMSFFNWWTFGICSGVFVGVTVIVYVQDRFGWGVADVILTAGMAISIFVFLAGKPFYRFRAPSGSPLTPMMQVLVAAVRKRKLPHPSEIIELHEVSQTDKLVNGRLLYHTEKFKFLDKAAIVEDTESLEEKRRTSLWRLATVTKVEELKLILNMIPIWLSTLPFGICVAQSSTFFIKQAATLDRKIFDGRFLIPTASVFSLSAVGSITCVAIYDKLLIPYFRRATGTERGINILQRIGIGMIFSVTTMVIAALVESKRLNTVEQNGWQTGSLTMNVFWLAPQFVVTGIGNAFTLVGLQEYFYDQVPDSMRTLGIAFYLSVLGAGNFLSSLLITAVDYITAKRGASWFGSDLNRSRLDNFYWLLAAITAANLCVYVILARGYSYKNVQRVEAGASHEEDDSMGLNLPA